MELVSIEYWEIKCRNYIHISIKIKINIMEQILTDNVVIEALTTEHGKEIVKYFQSLGVYTVHYQGCQNKANGNNSIYYGVINGQFSNYLLETVEKANAKIIQLPTNNTVIKALTREHVKEIIEYFKSLGIDTNDYEGSNNKADNDANRYYGVINGKFHIYSMSNVERANAKIIQLPTNTNNKEISNEILKNQEKIEYENFLRLKRKFDNGISKY